MAPAASPDLQTLSLTPSLSLSPSPSTTFLPSYYPSLIQRERTAMLAQVAGKRKTLLSRSRARLLSQADIFPPSATEAEAEVTSEENEKEIARTEARLTPSPPTPSLTTLSSESHQHSGPSHVRRNFTIAIPVAVACFVAIILSYFLRRKGKWKWNWRHTEPPPPPSKGWKNGVFSISEMRLPIRELRKEGGRREAERRKKTEREKDMSLRLGPIGSGTRVRPEESVSATVKKTSAAAVEEKDENPGPSHNDPHIKPPMHATAAEPPTHSSARALREKEDIRRLHTSTRLRSLPCSYPSCDSSHPHPKLPEKKRTPRQSGREQAKIGGAVVSTGSSSNLCKIKNGRGEDMAVGGEQQHHVGGSVSGKNIRIKNDSFSSSPQYVDPGSQSITFELQGTTSTTAFYASRPSSPPVTPPTQIVSTPSASLAFSPSKRWKDASLKSSWPILGDSVADESCSSPIVLASPIFEAERGSREGVPEPVHATEDNEGIDGDMVILDEDKDHKNPFVGDRSEPSSSSLLSNFDCFSIGSASSMSSVGSISSPSLIASQLSSSSSSTSSRPFYRFDTANIEMSLDDDNESIGDANSKQSQPPILVDFQRNPQIPTESSVEQTSTDAQAVIASFQSQPESLSSSVLPSSPTPDSNSIPQDLTAQRHETDDDWRLVVRLKVHLFIPRWLIMKIF